ncbi:MULTISPECIES: DUF7544 domain-containing protein [Halorussus]|uniref:DUF7544 domain-containing protein n=1 Tax=Halorussus TaxID=1070314 RepID=UPI0020A13F59|nr:hypothetical protein [Halorussus vallis]USZ76166.1 hypothetical protein NGM07_02295 [Halorussus vallis]
MSWYAVDALGDAFEATRDLLTPLSAGQWLKLALVVFFLGGTGGTGGPSASAGSSTGSAPADFPGGVQPSVPTETLFPILVGVFVVALLFGLAYALVGSIMEFVFVESLRRERVRVRGYADQHFGHGLRLFAFRVVLGLLVAVPALGAALTALSFFGDGLPRAAVGLLVVLVPLFVVLAVFVAVADGFTTNFVVPVMILRNVGVLDGWRAFWPTLTAEWRQYAVFVLVRFVLALAVGLVAAIVGGVVGAILLAPLAILGFIAIPLFGGAAGILSNPVALGGAALLLFGYGLVLTAALSVALVPVQVYLRYHALLVLGDTDADHDAIPELRRAIREGRGRRG